MIEKLSTSITNFFIDQDIIDPAEEAVYKYGTEVTISTLLGYFLIISTGIVLGRFFDSLLFLACFVSIRLFAGGYHADTYVKCNSTFVGVFLFYSLAQRIIPDETELYICIPLLIISLVIHSHVDDYRKNKNKKEV